MITVHKSENVKIMENGDVKATLELRGNSTDTKPTTLSRFCECWLENRLLDDCGVDICVI